jgi:diguanylate cyclase (GGDEF)-like protein
MGLQLRIPPSDIAAFWPASGVGLAAVINLIKVGAPRFVAYSAVPVGYLLVALPIRGISWEVVGYTIANGGEAVLAAELLRRLASGGIARGISAGLVGRFVLAAVAAPLVSGLLAGVVHGFAINWNGALHATVTWWLADSLGILALGPVLVSLSATAELWPRLGRSTAEVAAASTAVLGALAWMFIDPEAAYAFPAVFATLWWALRFGVGPTALWMSVVATGAGFATAGGGGPFAGPFALILTQVFVALYVVAILSVAAAAESRRLAMEGLRTYARELEHANSHDGLTGALLLAELRRQVQRLPVGERVGVAIIDVDNLGEINEEWGREVGDLLLKSLTQRFLVARRDKDILARLGGDEFVIFMRDIPDEATAEKIAAHFTDAMLLPVEVGGNSIRTSISIGVTAGEIHEFEPLLREADFALHSAKASGRNRIVVRSEQQRHEALEQRLLADRLDGAIEDGELFCHFQPIFHLGGAVAPGAEALVRWRHPEKGLLSPAMFLPPQERAGRMDVVGDFVMRVALGQVGTWIRSGDPEAPQWVSVNVSPGELRSGDLHHRVSAALTEARCEASRLVLELTEETMVQMNAQTRYQLEALREAGVRIAIDDFGTGYSSLAYLSRLPIDVLKLDAAFVGGAGLERDTRLLRAVCALARDIGLTTVIEGVESTDQLTDAVSAGADAVQGFLLGRPGPAVDVRTRRIDLAEFQERSVTVVRQPWRG